MDFYQEIPLLVEHLQKGELILYPTDTVWGIGCDATNEAAIAKIDDLKKRKSNKNYLLLLDSYENLLKYVEYVPVKARNLIEYHTRPLTIIYETPKNLPSRLLAEDGSIAIRITKDAFCLKLIESFGKPIISTSANMSGSPVAQSFKEIDANIKNSIKAIALYRQNEEIETTPSTIVAVKDDKDLIFLRK